MNEKACIDGYTCLFLPRPWLEADIENVREDGPLRVWHSADRKYVKGVVGTKVLAYWYRVVSIRSAVTPM